jgi:hypothetical protein
MAQAGRAFQPEILVVPEGATVSFPNRDIYAHNVFSTTPGNSFDLGLYKSGGSKSVTFENPGVVNISCNVHPQMNAWVIVVTNPFVAQPGSDGAFSLRGVPPGNYHLAAWFPYGAPVRQEVHLGPGARLSLRLDLRERRGGVLHNDKTGKPYSHYPRSAEAP